MWGVWLSTYILVLDTELVHAMLTMAVTENRWRTVVICLSPEPWPNHAGPTEADRPQQLGHPTVDSPSRQCCTAMTRRGTRTYVKLLAYEMAVRRSGGPAGPTCRQRPGSRLSQSRRRMARAAGALHTGRHVCITAFACDANWNPNTRTTTTRYSPPNYDGGMGISVTV